MTTVNLSANLPYTWNQGSGPECVSEAVAGLYAYKLKQAGLPVFEPSRAFHRYNCLTADLQAAIRAGKSSRMTDTGTSPSTGMAVLKAQGLCSEATWPHTKRFDAAPGKPAYDEAFKHRITGATSVTSRRGPDGLYPLADFKALLDAGEPFVIAFILGDDGHLHIDGAFNLIGPPEPIVWRGQTNHAVIVCGYDDGRQAFRVRNSYGPGFGDKGDFWIANHLLTNPLFAFDGWSIESVWSVDVELARIVAERKRLGLPAM